MDKIKKVNNLNNGLKIGIILFLAILLLSNVASATVYTWTTSPSPVTIAPGITTNWSTCVNSSNIYDYKISSLTNTSTSGCSIAYHDTVSLDPAVDMFLNTNYSVDTNVQGDWYFGHLSASSGSDRKNVTFRFNLIYVLPNGTIRYLTGSNSTFVLKGTHGNYNISLAPISGMVPAGAKLGLRISKIGETPTSKGSIYVGDTASYLDGQKSGYFSVSETPFSKITPTITWANPADITYGTALGITQLNAVASVPGSYVYNPVAGTVMNAGLGQTLHVDFTPTDTVNYNSASKDVTINVMQATPIITWSNPADITYGTALGATQLNALASVPGTYVYTPAAGTVLIIGANQILHAAFTPTDTTNYTDASKDVTINVTGTLPTVRYINGTVTNSSVLHEALGGVKITTGSFTTYTDSNGKYSLTVVSGSYPLIATYGIRYYTGSRTVSTEFDAVVNQDIELRLKPVGTISGTVRVGV